MAFALRNHGAKPHLSALDLGHEPHESRPAAMRTSAGLIPAPAAVETAAPVSDSSGHAFASTAGAPYVQRSITSREAARQIASHMPELRHRVWCEIEFAGANGLTDEEVSERTGMAGNTVRPRRIELERDGFVVDSGRTRVTASGRRATVWITIEQAPKTGPVPCVRAAVREPSTDADSLPPLHSSEQETAATFSAQQALFDLLGLT